MNNVEFLFASGLDFNHLFVLQNIDNLPEINRITGYYNILQAKGFIEDGILSDKGQEIISLFKKEENIINSEMLNKMDKEIDNVMKSEQTFSEWVVNLHKKLQDKLVELTGSKNPKLVFEGKITNHSYFCHSKDLEAKIKVFTKKYEYYDFKRIEALLLKHCEVRNMKIERYIIKQGAEKGSGLASDYENYSENQEKNSNFEGTNI